jgi:hypothetical protein
MAVLNPGALTLIDWAKRLDPDGKIPAIAELLSQSNEILEDAVYAEGNLPTGHRVVIRTGLPAVYFRALNKGVPFSKSDTVQVDETVAMLEAYARVDSDLAALNGNTAQFRLSEDRSFIEAMNQRQVQAMLYGNPAGDPLVYQGFSPRYSQISGAPNGQNIIDAGGTGSANTSIWLINWGEDTVFNVFPKGSKAGLIHNDLGELTVYDEDGNPYQALQTHYQWKNGLVVKDWRHIVRIANIDTGELVDESSSAADIVKLMSRAMDRIPSFSQGRAAFYVNRTLFSMLRIQALSKSQNAMAITPALSQFGTPQNWTTFQGVPIRRVDQLLNTEARVV